MKVPQHDFIDMQHILGHFGVHGNWYRSYWFSGMYNSHTVEPLLKDILDKEHNGNYLPTKDTLETLKIDFYSASTFHTSQQWVTSPQWTKWLLPMCPL